MSTTRHSGMILGLAEAFPGQTSARHGRSHSRSRSRSRSRGRSHGRRHG